MKASEVNRFNELYERHLKTLKLQGKKKKDDLAYHHRKNGLNRFYANMMNFEQGDEILQIGYFRMVSVVKYILRQRRVKQLNRQQEHPVLEL